MNMLPTLRTALLDLLYETRDADLRLIIGGGYGIYLKREHIQEAAIPTLLRELPEARSTNDLDLFLRPELLIQAGRLRALSTSLARLGYVVVSTAEKYQFAKPGPSGGRDGGLKVDILTGPRSKFLKTSARVDERRVRPQPSVDLHAHPVDEAVTLEERLMPLALCGTTNSGQIHESEIFLPHPLTFAMMKLFAFRDRRDDPEKDRGSYHALDLYAVLATTSEAEWRQAHELRTRYADTAEVIEAGRFVETYFSSKHALGTLRLQESPYYRPAFQLDEFRGALQELFPSP
jgi:hypothetical protein